MRIHSKFKDYYDGMQDHDSDLVYVRLNKDLLPNDHVSRVMNLHTPNASTNFKWSHERRIGQDQADKIAREWSGHIAPKYLEPSFRMSSSEESYNRYEGVGILFCGKLYRGVRYREQWEEGGGMPKYVDKFYWSRELFEKDHVLTESKSKYDNHIDRARDAAAYLARTFTVVETPDLMDVHFMTRCPVIGGKISFERNQRYGDFVAVMNPCLKDVQFIRVMDPTIMFQELSMFLGGVLSNNDKPEPVDNKYKIVAHGFDLKESFRKGPTKEHR